MCALGAWHLSSFTLFTILSVKTEHLTQTAFTCQAHNKTSTSQVFCGGTEEVTKNTGRSFWPFSLGYHEIPSYSMRMISSEPEIINWEETWEPASFQGSLHASNSFFSAWLMFSNITIPKMNKKQSNYIQLQRSACVVYPEMSTSMDFLERCGHSLDRQLKVCTRI